MRNFAVALAAIGWLVGCAPRDPVAGVFQWTHAESGVTTWIEYEGRGWRGLRTIELHSMASADTPEVVIEALWTCTTHALLMPSRYENANANNEKSLSIGANHRNVRRFFELTAEQFEGFESALAEVCSSVPDFQEPPSNILLSYDDDSITHLEASRFRRTGQVVDTWIRVESLKGGVEDSTSTIDPTVGVQLAEVRFDCSNGTWATTQLNLFNSDGSPRATLPFNGDFASVVPGTQADAMLTTACLIE